MYIDTHCHLTFSDFDADRAMVIGNAKKAGVRRFIVPGVDAYSSAKAIALAERNPGIVFSGIGYHPYEAQKNPSVHGLEAHISHGVVAIGECGLDYHRYKHESAAGNKTAQRILFDEQLRLALRHNLPVIMHCRDAFEDFFKVLDGLPTTPRGVIHCFSGGLQELREAKRRNLFVGIDGNVTYSGHLSLVVPHIPLAMILLETDAPYLTPVPNRGKRNEPKYIPFIAKHIAALLHASVDEIKRQTTENAVSLFSLPQPS